MIHSTRSTQSYSIFEAIEKGLASDGGLFVIDEFKKVNLTELKDLSYHELVIEILKDYIPGIDKIISETYPDFEIKVKTFDNYAYLELFHGPTLAFKDVALSFLPFFLDNKRIVVATSGDTGSATLSGFKNKKNISVTVLYPNNLVSPLQERQMLYFTNERNSALALNGNFDDCQKLAKELALKDKNLSSANSINIGRLLPQIIYYFYGYFSLVRENKIKMNEKIDIVVPTGNFGNILAGYIAKNMGLPVETLICASNENKVLYDFIKTGIYDSNREFKKTYSPSMDILVSSNIERLIYYFYKDVNKVNELYDEFKRTGKMQIKEYRDLFKDFDSAYVTNTEVLKEIKHEYQEKNYLIDPHTAVAKCAYNKVGKNNYTLILSTASPFKFEDALKDAGINMNEFEMPDNLKCVLKDNKQKIVVEKEDVEKYIYKGGKNI
ncbi:threonine synthase [bacterium]|nr:threonine synthase [bacterium]